MGRSINAFNTGGITPIAPSAVPCHIQQHEVHEVTYEEIQVFKADYLQCVKNAKEAGFEVVMLHFINGYFLAQWLSGLTNKRTDEYGGTFENRLRLPMEIIQMIKRETGASPVVPRIPGVDVDNAITAVSVLQGKNWTGDIVAIIGGMGCRGVFRNGKSLVSGTINM